MNPQPKHKPWRSKKYLDYIREQTCLICGENQTEAHHTKIFNHGGKSRKPSDYWCIPLCMEHHNEIHNKGVKTFYKSYEVDIWIDLFTMVSEYLKKITDN